MQHNFLIKTAMQRQLKSDSAEPYRAQEEQDIEDGDPYREFGSLSANKDDEEEDDDELER